MRWFILVSAGILLGCSVTSGPDRRRVLAAIAGYHVDDPYVEVTSSGRVVSVSVTTFGSSCNSKADTEVSVDGLVATIVPYNFPPPAGTPCPRDLRHFVHEVTVRFQRGGVATVRVRGLDARGRSAANMIGDTIVVERSVTIP